MDSYTLRKEDTMTTSYLVTTERAIVAELLRAVEFNKNRITSELITQKITIERNKVLANGAPVHIRTHLLNLLNVVELRLKTRYCS